MAIVTQEVTLRIVYDDAKLNPPHNWAWPSAMTCGHAHAGKDFQVADVRAGDVEAATSAEAVEFVTR